jgi:collagen type III alpha
MMFKHLLFVAAIVGFRTCIVHAQPPAGQGPFGGGRPMNPLIRALDLDGDGEISTAELEKAVTSLKALDRNGDGKLTEDELRPAPGGPGGGFGGGPGGPAPGAARGQGGVAPGGAMTTEQIVARYMGLDANKDGKLTKDEIPERLQSVITRADSDGDEIVTKEELTKMAERQTAGGRGGFGAPGGGPPGFGGGPGGRGGPGGFGPPNPQSFVDRAMEFDADKDGKLSREELAKMAEQTGPGRGGPPQPRPGQ